MRINFSIFLKQNQNFKIFLFEKQEKMNLKKKINEF